MRDPAMKCRIAEFWSKKRSNIFFMYKLALVVRGTFCLINLTGQKVALATPFFYTRTVLLFDGVQLMGSLSRWTSTVCSLLWKVIQSRFVHATNS